MVLVKYSVILGLIFIYMILRMVKKSTSESDEEAGDQPQVQGFALNNLVHNPAMIRNLQIVTIVLVLLFGGLSSTQWVQNPSDFILGNLVAAIACYLVIPILLYAFNKKLRTHWKGEMMASFGKAQVSPVLPGALQEKNGIFKIEPSVKTEEVEHTQVEAFVQDEGTDGDLEMLEMTPVQKF